MSLENLANPSENIIKLNPDDPLYKQILAMEQMQRAAIEEAGSVLSRKFGAKAEAVQLRIEKEGILISYLIKKSPITRV